MFGLISHVSCLIYQIYGAVWNPYRKAAKAGKADKAGKAGKGKGALEDLHHFDFVTFGKRHLTFWTFTIGGELFISFIEIVFIDCIYYKSFWTFTTGGGHELITDN